MCKCEHGKVWTGTASAHCRGCCKTFTSFAAFDRHRRNSHCLDPEAQRTESGFPVFSLTEKGYWSLWVDPEAPKHWDADGGDSAPTESQLIREWAQERGYPVADRGRISREIQELYRSQAQQLVLE